MSFQGQHFLRGYLKTTSVGLAGVLNPRPPTKWPNAQPTEVGSYLCSYRTYVNEGNLANANHTVMEWPYHWGQSFQEN